MGHVALLKMLFFSGGKIITPGVKRKFLEVPRTQARGPLRRGTHTDALRRAQPVFGTTRTRSFGSKKSF